MGKTVAGATKPVFGSNQGSNLLEKHGFNAFEKNPYELPYKDLSIGEKYNIRLLTLSTWETRVLYQKRVEIFVNKEKYTGWINTYVPFMLTWRGDAQSDQEYVDGKDGKPLFHGEDVLSKFQDHKGTNLLEAKTARFYRIPVWVYDKVNNKGKSEEVGKLMYMEINEFMKNAIIQLPKTQQGAFEFNSESGLPDFDMEIRAIKGQNGMKNYEIDGVMGNPRNPHPNYGVPTEKALAEFVELINEEWATLQDNMNDFITVEGIESRLRKPESSSTGLSQRPMLTEKQQELAEQATSEEDGTSEQEAPVFAFGR